MKVLNRFFIFDKEPVLFNTTIKENILYGTKEKVSDKELRSACKEANALEFIENFTDKFETNVGPGKENEIFFVSLRSRYQILFFAFDFQILH